MSGLPLAHAVFGPLATGADVRLLATSRGLSLSAKAKAELSSFYNAGWALARRRKRPYWAWFPIDGGFWALAKAQCVGEGVVGALFVVWFAIFDAEAAEAIGGQSYRLWRSAYPEPLELPVEGSVMAPRFADFDAEHDLPLAQEQLADQLAYAIWKDNHVGTPARYSVSRSLGPDGETALAGALERLGGWAAGRSYCTWSGIGERGFSPASGPFDILLTMEWEPNAGAVPPVPDAAPEAWYVRRAQEAGIPVPDFFAGEPHLPDKLAEQWMQRFRGELVGARCFKILRDVTDHSPETRLGALRLLELMVPELEADAPAQADAIDFFILNLLPAVPRDPARARPEQRLASLAIHSRVALLLHPDAITAVASELIGPEERRDLSAMLLEQLRAVRGGSVGESARAVRQQSLKALLESIPPERTGGKLQHALLGALWDGGFRAQAAVTSQLSMIEQPEDLVEAYLEIADFVPPGCREAFAARHLGDIDGGIAPSRARDEEDWCARGIALLSYWLGVARGLENPEARQH